MGTMTEDEVIDSTYPIIADWINNENGILSQCVEKEKEMEELYGPDMYMCPFLQSMLHIAQANIHKGWNKAELLEMIDEMIDDVEDDNTN